MMGDIKKSIYLSIYLYIYLYIYISIYLDFLTLKIFLLFFRDDLNVARFGPNTKTHESHNKKVKKNCFEFFLQTWWKGMLSYWTGQEGFLIKLFLLLYYFYVRFVSFWPWVFNDISVLNFYFVNSHTCHKYVRVLIRSALNSALKWGVLEFGSEISFLGTIENEEVGAKR